MRFLHTADWHIGLAAAFAGAAASRVREARLEAARRAVRAAREHSAEFIVVAGDTFDHNAVARNVVSEVAEILASAQCPAFVIPGNHDPLQPGSAWDHPAWASSTNVRVLSERTPVAVAGGTLYPCPLTRKRSEEDPTAWIPKDGNGIRIAIAHGNAGDILADDGGHPIPFDAAARASLDYLALGHWHSTLEFPAGGVTRMAYSGAPEPASFSEHNSGNVLLIEIREHGAAPAIRSIHTGVLSFLQMEENITSPGQLPDLARRISAMPDAAVSLLDLRLRGLLFERDRDELTRIRSGCARFLHSRFDDGGLRPAPDDDEWVRGLPAGLIREAAERLRGLAADGSPQAAPALQALLELYAIHSEARS